MNFQGNTNVISWYIHFNSNPHIVYQALSTDEGRAKYWAESTEENNGHITFNIINFPPSTGSVIY